MSGILRALAAIAVATAWMAAATPAFAQDAADDSTGVAASDSTASPTDAFRDLQAMVDEARASQASSDSSGAAAEPYLLTWKRSPKASVRAQMQKVVYGGEFGNALAFRDLSSVSVTGRWSRENYRAQDKTIELRNGAVTYATDSAKSYAGTLTMNDSWSRDQVTNSVGLTNTNRRDTRIAQLMLKRQEFEGVGGRHRVELNGSYTDQKAEQLGTRNDIAESDVNGAVRSTVPVADGVRVLTAAYGTTQNGERSLGQATSPSSTRGDTLRAGVAIDRGFWQGAVSVSSSNFEKRYLDYNRNPNGIIDTLNVDEKIVHELESNDAVTYSWNNIFRVAGVRLGASLARDVSSNGFRASRVGTRERHQDTMKYDMSFRLTRLDSVQILYNYLFKWDDQTYKGATSSRGRQNSKQQDLKINWVHQLFPETALKVAFANGLSQEIAANRNVNVNDRDRLDTSLTVKTDTEWDSGVKVNMSFDVRRVEDLSIRSERSANNNIKDTYEVAPGYFWPVADWLDLNQTFRVWIQYTDYVYSDIPDLNKQDDYNKRGNVTTKVTVKPNSRLTLTVRHDYNARANAKKTSTDATGHSQYSRIQKQNISKIDFGLTYKVTRWFTLDGTTYQSRDFKESYGNATTETERLSGEVVVGGQIEPRFKDRTHTFKVGLRKHFAHGPSIQDYSREYWDADIQIAWGF